MTEFGYIDAPSADRTSVTFVAEAKPSGQKLMIKFVEQYGVEAHELLAGEGIVHRPLYFGLLDGESDARKSGVTSSHGNIGFSGSCAGPACAVVMEHTVDKAPALPKDLRGNTEEAIKKLCGAQPIFGVLRAPNVIFSRDKAFLMDSGRVGRVNEARYPSRSVERQPSWNWSLSSCIMTNSCSTSYFLSNYSPPFADNRNSWKIGRAHV